MALPRPPVELNRCQCSVCRRYGVAWAYYRPNEVVLEAGADATEIYVRDGGELEFHRCPRCGNLLAWRAPDAAYDRMGVNANLLEAADLEGVPVRVTEGPPA